MTNQPLQATITQRGVIFEPRGEILLVKRATDGEWELPGGRVDRHEDAREALAREILEETSLTPDTVTPVHTTTWLNSDGNGRFAVYYYCLAEDQSVTLSDEHQAFEWAQPSKICARLTPPQQAAVAESVVYHNGSSALHGSNVS